MPQFWAGFCDGHIHTDEVDTGFGGKGVTIVRMPKLFTSRTNARREYEDVRKVEVRVVSKRARSKR